MNYRTLIASTFAVTALMLPVTISATVQPYDLPDGIVSVDPVQGVVDLSNNANPLGVAQISVVFSSTNLESNPNAVGNVLLYMNNEAEAIDQLPASEATVDQYTHQYGSIMFPNKHTAIGTYHVVIPEGTWLVDENPSPTIELAYEILNETTIVPEAGMVDELSNITITYNLADQVEIFKQSIAAYPQGSTKNCAVTTEIEGNVVNMGITMEDGSALTAGTYIVFLPAKTFKLTTYGANYANDETDVTVDYSKEITLKYVIPAFPKQPIEPEEGNVEGFMSFTITPNDDFQLSMVDDKTKSYIYKVEEDGSLATDYSYRLTGKSSSGTVVLSVLDSSWSAVTEPVVPEEGKYALVLADGLFWGMYNGEFVSSAAYVYYYNVVSDSTGIHIVEATPANETGIFTISGAKVSGNNLSNGIYIINGKKVLVK